MRSIGAIVNVVNGARGRHAGAIMKVGAVLILVSFIALTNLFIHEIGRRLGVRVFLTSYATVILFTGSKAQNGYCNNHQQEFHSSYLYTKVYQSFPHNQNHICGGERIC